ncbi:MAG TPA: hypothetical protein DEV93_15850 [Chloroflexi bacterium]|nr:hypothetical protein [Chloroflexota bacterium]
MHDWIAPVVHAGAAAKGAELSGIKVARSEAIEVNVLRITREDGGQINGRRRSERESSFDCVRIRDCIDTADELT